MTTDTTTAPAAQVPTRETIEATIRSKISEFLGGLEGVEEAASEIIALYAPHIARLERERDEARAFIGSLVHMQSGDGWTRATVREAAQDFLDTFDGEAPLQGDTTPILVLRQNAVARAERAEAALATAEAEGMRKAAGIVGSVGVTLKLQDAAATFTAAILAAIPKGK